MFFQHAEEEGLKQDAKRYPQPFDRGRNEQLELFFGKIKSTWTLVSSAAYIGSNKLASTKENFDNNIIWRCWPVARALVVIGRVLQKRRQKAKTLDFISPPGFILEDQSNFKSSTHASCWHVFPL
jgi:hypothetical protein